MADTLTCGVPEPGGQPLERNADIPRPGAVMKFCLLNILMLADIAFFALGGGWLWAGFGLALVLSIGVDTIAGDDLAVDSAATRHPFYDLMLYATLPLLAVLSFQFLALASSDVAVPVAAIAGLAGWDLTAARAATNGWGLAGGFLTLGMLYGAGGVNVAHELIHRTGDRAAWTTGRLLLGLTFDAAFAIEHVHNHHRNVGTPADPATARRGETVYGFILRSTFGGWASAARIEAALLVARGRPALSWANRVLRGYLISAAYCAFALALFGMAGLLAFLLLAVQGKVYLELVNYIEHYGLVRQRGKPVEARHSWNTQRRISNWLLYNLPRHSDHHAFASKPFWSLDPGSEAPRLPFGYELMILIALVPPLFRALMHRRLADWDRRFASTEERRLLEARGQWFGEPAGVG